MDKKSQICVNCGAKCTVYKYGSRGPICHACAGVPHRSNRIQPVKSKPKIGRNELCPCGSGKKYKKCCIKK